MVTGEVWKILTVFTLRKGKVVPVHAWGSSYNVSQILGALEQGSFTYNNIGEYHNKVGVNDFNQHKVIATRSIHNPI